MVSDLFPGANIFSATAAAIATLLSLHLMYKHMYVATSCNARNLCPIRLTAVWQQILAKQGAANTNHPDPVDDTDIRGMSISDCLLLHIAPQLHLSCCCCRWPGLRHPYRPGGQTLPNTSTRYVTATKRSCFTRSWLTSKHALTPSA